MHWQAGDIAEIDPRNSTWHAGAAPLPHREYSIASLPADGAIHLLVRQMRRPDGESGLGSGWLTAGARVGEEVALRVRRNPNFHPPADGVPLLLIGNGTGIAGLRALLKARIAAGHARNWLIFGERNRLHDALYAHELEGWRAAGLIERIDWVFSRDQPERRYVQDCIRANSAQLRLWLANGAAVYVCGSLQGMAPAVEAALLEALGTEQFRALSAHGKYRRDVY
jgi:sulfite reductase (NADPH) flavoprotein alpha-component